MKNYELDDLLSELERVVVRVRFHGDPLPGVDTLREWADTLRSVQGTLLAYNSVTCPNCEYETPIEEQLG
jgi:hypothetical protein